MLVRFSIKVSRMSATGSGTGDAGVPEPQQHVIAVADEVVEGEADDATQRLGVEQHDHSSGA